MSKISYVIPVYHNEGSIALTCAAIRDLYVGELQAHEYEIMLVDDGSTDRSWEEMQEVASSDPHVRLIRFTRNFGQLAAMMAGYQRATGDAVINLSADLQDPVSLTATMVQRWLGGSEIVIAFREEREDSFATRLFSRLAYGALRWSNRAIPAGGFDFVLMSRRALDAFLSYRGRNRFFQGDVLWSGLSTTFLPYTRRERPVGRSQYTFGKKLKLFFDWWLDGSYLPIRLMSVCGATLAALGALYAGAIAVSWALHLTPFPGWAPIMVAILLIGGVIMLMLGVIGEYLWRILDEIKAKPLFIIDES